ncbi:MATE family efflux transporter [Nonomuraea sp. NPDC050663]|uniref:MATE family efflux transporter n=1 Tax=Nonomuraea sp. NPDC050663 TaxID=3364370 RepID=UPI0037BC38A9
MPFRPLLSSAVPLFLSMITSMVGGVVFTIALGHHATESLAAFALSMAVLGPATAAVAGSLRGMVPFIAPHRADPAAALPILRDARWLTLTVGTVGAALVACVPLIARVSGAPAEVVDAMGALPWLLALYVLVFASSGGANSVLIALGRSRQVLWSSLTGTVVDIVLTFALVPVMGPAGAGLAMVVSAMASIQVSVLCLRRVPGLGGLSQWPGRPRVAEIVKLARVGLPLAGTILIKFGVLAVVTYAAARTGLIGAAAHAVLNSAIGLLFLAALAVAQASVPEVARATTTAEVRRVNRAALILGLSGAGLGGSVLLLFGEWIFRLFTPDVAVQALALSLVPLLVVSTLADAAQAVMGFGLAGLKRSSWSLAAFAVAYGVLAVAAHPVAATWGLTGLWVALIGNNVALVVLQGSGFLRHSARLGGREAATTTSVPATTA